MIKKDKRNLLTILESIEKIQKYIDPFKDHDEFYKDEIRFEATMMNFVIIGEMVAKLSETFKTKEDSINWRKLKELRNIVAHEYFGIDVKEVWEIIKSDLSEIKPILKEILSKE